MRVRARALEPAAPEAPADPAEPMDSAEPMDPAEPVDPAELMDPAEPVDPPIADQHGGGGRHSARRGRVRRRRGRTKGMERPWMDFRDLWTEALAGVLARPMRSALTTLGTVLGITTLVITIGVSATAGNQIVGRFDALSATSVTVEVPQAVDSEPLVGWSGVDAVRRLAGVESVAALGDSTETASVQVRANDVVSPGDVSGQTVAVFAASPALPAAVRGRMTAGRFFDDGNIARRDRVAVLGDQAARLLGITSVKDSPAVFLKDQSYTVIGILGGAEREQQVATSVILPPTTAEDRLGLGAVTRVVINTSLGAAKQVARQAPIALAPGSEAALVVTAPSDPTKARKGVQGDVNGMFLVLGLVSLVVGAIGIANVTLVTVMERIGEIGLRRALGASRRQIAGQFLVESTTIGLLGGVIGAVLGMVVVVAVSAIKDWTPVLDVRLAFGAPVAGALVGLLAGLYPSLRASRMEPVDALRS